MNDQMAYEALWEEQAFESLRAHKESCPVCTKAKLWGPWCASGLTLRNEWMDRVQPRRAPAPAPGKEGDGNG